MQSLCGGIYINELCEVIFAIKPNSETADKTYFLHLQIHYWSWKALQSPFLSYNDEHLRQGEIFFEETKTAVNNKSPCSHAASSPACALNLHLDVVRDIATLLTALSSNPGFYRKVTQKRIWPDFHVPCSSGNTILGSGYTITEAVEAVVDEWHWDLDTAELC